MEWEIMTDVIDVDSALDHIDVLMADAAASRSGVPAALPPSTPTARPAAVPVDRMVLSVERLLLIRDTLDDAPPSPALRASLTEALRDVAELCDAWGFAGARARVDLVRDDVRAGAANVTSE